MGADIILTCDGCQTKIAREDLAATAEVFAEWAKEMNFDAQSARGSHQEIYCSRCRERAMEYWTAKHALVNSCIAEMSNRVRKHKSRFWCAAPSKGNLLQMGAK